MLLPVLPTRPLALMHVNAAVNNLNNALATCPKLKGIALLTLVRAVGGTRKCGDSTCPIISPKCEMMVSAR